MSAIDYWTGKGNIISCDHPSIQGHTDTHTHTHTFIDLSH